uniref:26S proteasome non-ATPase regulatory subunit 13 n=2 Tax=Cacopsylla melanoneura TaxID=428564 RepID=A0A8D8WDG5_9HEMI
MSTMVDPAIFLTGKQEAHSNSPEILAQWANLEDLYNKKLWHQLTLAVLKFVQNPNLQKEEDLRDLYHKFILSFETKINPVQLMEIMEVITSHLSDKVEALILLQSFDEKVKNNLEAKTLCKILQAQLIMNKDADKPGQLEDVEKLIDEIELLVNDIEGVTAIHSRFYLVASTLYRKQAKLSLYYRTALRYLGCVDLNDLSARDQVQHAFLIGLAALLADSVYNIGELLAHPILDSLQETPNAWLVELLQAFNAGDIDKFEHMRPQWSGMNDIKANENKLSQKIALLCLMELAFKKIPGSHQLTFAEISEAAKLPLIEVEFLIIKALALGLVKGHIDQVDESFNVSWVQPRVLSKDQLRGMGNRLDAWKVEVSGMENSLHELAKDFLNH